MKVLKITFKNLKMLLRSKTSILVVIFGPLLIMLLVGFAFNNPSASKLNIGYVAPEQTNLTISFVNALESNPNFIVAPYPSEESCNEMIAQGKMHVCIIFPKDFNLQDNKTNEIVFYVDQSRANFVYAVIETVSSKIDFTTNQLSYQLTDDLIGVIGSAKQLNNDNLLKIIKLKATTDDLTATMTTMQNNLNSLDLNKSSVSSGSINNNLNQLQDDIIKLRDQGNAVVKLASDFNTNVVTGVNNATLQANFVTNLDNSSAAIKTQGNTTISDLQDMNDAIGAMLSDVDKMNKRLDMVQTTTTDAATKIAAMKVSLAEVKTNLESIKSGTESLNAQINALRITSASSIVNPVKTTIKPVSAKTSNLNFIFPYLLVLIIVFISIMLSSNIIIMEKTSRAYFRNFTTPTSDLTFIISVFLTSFVVVILQLILILALAYYFLNTTLSANLVYTSILIFISIALFTLIGMIIGYFFKSQEAVTMAAISVGSVLLFLSNLVLPLENMSTYLQEVAHYNPYVIASEALKKVTIFGAQWTELQNDLAFLAFYIIIGIILVIAVQKMSKIQYISKKPTAKQLLKKEDFIDKYLKLNSGVLVRNEKELLEELKKMSDVSFNEYVAKDKNDFESWLLRNKNDKLAKEVGKCKTREETIKILEKKIKK